MLTGNQILLMIRIINKFFFRNIYAPLGAKFWFIFSVEANLYKAGNHICNHIKWTTQWAQE